MSDVPGALGSVLSFELFSLSDTSVTVRTLLTIALIVIVTFWVSRILRAALRRFFAWRGHSASAIATASAFLHFAVLVTGFAVALGAAGIDLTALFAAGAIFAVGLGLAMQGIAQNFVAGVILLAERALKPGDVLEVEGKLVKVSEVRIRASIVRSRDGEDLIIPNATLIQTTVKNFTMGDSSYRIRARVGVRYGSDMALVKKVLMEVAENISTTWALRDRPPQVIITEFGDHSVNWEVAIWMSDPWESRPALSDLYEAVWWKLKEHGVVIAYPQLDVHFDPDAVEAWRSGRRSPS